MRAPKRWGFPEQIFLVQKVVAQPLGFLSLGAERAPRSVSCGCAAFLSLGTGLCVWGLSNLVLIMKFTDLKFGADDEIEGSQIYCKLQKFTVVFSC